MFCKSCGTNISDYSNFCSSCGEEQNNKYNCNISFDKISVDTFSGATDMQSSSGSILKSNYLEIFKAFNGFKYQKVLAKQSISFFIESYL